MRVIAVLAVMMAIAACAQEMSITLPPPPPGLEGVETSSFVEGQSLAEPNFAESHARVRMDAKYDFSTIPHDRQLDGNVAELDNAPGFVPAMNEEVLPGSLIPPPTSKDANSINDVKLWKILTDKIKAAQATKGKYEKWLKTASKASSKVKSHIKLTARNEKMIHKAIKGMTHERRQIVNRIKAAKLKRDLKKATEKLHKIDEFGTRLSTTAMKLRSGETSMQKRVKLLKVSLHDLRHKADDAAYAEPQMSSAGSASGEAGDEVPPSKHLKDRHARMEDETSLGAAEVDLALEGKSDGGELKGRWLTIPKGSMSLLYSHDKGAAPDLATGRVRIAAFDLDGTLITPKMLWQPFSKTRTDWKWWHPTVPERLRELHEQGYQIVVFSNRKDVWSGQQTLQAARGKAEDMMWSLSEDGTPLPISFYFAFQDDYFRKPQRGMWDIMEQMVMMTFDPNYIVGDVAATAASGAGSADAAVAAAAGSADAAAAGGAPQGPPYAPGGGAAAATAAAGGKTGAAAATASQTGAAATAFAAAAGTPSGMGMGDTASAAAAAAPVQDCKTSSASGWPRVTIDYAASFFVGDAGNRIGGPRYSQTTHSLIDSGERGKRSIEKPDHSNADSGFAANVGIKYSTPEQIFLRARPPLPDEIKSSTDPDALLVEAESKATPVPGSPTYKKNQSLILPLQSFLPKEPRQEIVVLTGPPASGKTTLYQLVFQPQGYEWINQDVLGKREYCLAAANGYLSKGKSVVIDNTNPTADVRELYINLARMRRVPIRSIVLDVFRELAIHQSAMRSTLSRGRVKELPRSAFHTFYTKATTPSRSEGFETVQVYKWRPMFKEVDGLLSAQPAAHSGASAPSVHYSAPPPSSVRKREDDSVCVPFAPPYDDAGTWTARGGARSDTDLMETAMRASIVMSGPSNESRSRRAFYAVYD